MGNITITEAREVLRKAKKEMDYSEKGFARDENQRISKGIEPQVWKASQARYKAALQAVEQAKADLDVLVAAEFQEQKEYAFRHSPNAKPAYEKLMLARKTHLTARQKAKDLDNLVSLKLGELKALERKNDSSFNEIKSIVTSGELDEKRVQLRKLYAEYLAQTEKESECAKQCRSSESLLYVQLKKVSVSKKKEAITNLKKAYELIEAIGKDDAICTRLMGKEMRSPNSLRLHEIDLAIKSLEGR